MAIWLQRISPTVVRRGVGVHVGDVRRGHSRSCARHSHRAANTIALRSGMAGLYPIACLPPGRGFTPRWGQSRSGGGFQRLQKWSVARSATAHKAAPPGLPKAGLRRRDLKKSKARGHPGEGQKCCPSLRPRAPITMIASPLGAQGRFRRGRSQGRARRKRRAEANPQHWSP